MNVDSVTPIRHRCNGCGKPYFAEFNGTLPAKTALVVTDCRDCTPPSGPRVLKFFDAEGERLHPPQSVTD